MFETEAIYSVTIATKLLGISKVDIEFVDSEFLKGKTITSMYLPDYNLILFNQDWLATARLEEVILTAFHETRHAYQKAQIEGVLYINKREKPETVMKWKQEFEKYYRPSNEYQDDPGYLNQEIEKDAIGFSQIWLLQLGLLSA